MTNATIRSACTRTQACSGPRGRVGWSLLACCLAVAGCAYAPGMTLDTTSAALAGRAELLTIDPPTVQRLQSEQRARTSALPALPASFLNGEAQYEYRVAAQDILRVTVWDRPELTNPSGTTQELSGRVVNADGTFFFPYAGTVRAGGRSVQDIRDQIVVGLRTVIRSPQVDVSVLQFRGQRIYVSGEVRSPGALPVTDVPPDLTEVIARAGGLTADADLTGVTVTRDKETARLDLLALYYRGDLRNNVRLRHGDILNVPERRAAKVFVTGEVIRPTAVLMPRGPFTLADALAEAGGVNPLSANAGQVYVIRGTEAARPQIYHLNAAAPDALLLADRFALNARDVVYVDVAQVVRWARVINNILPSATALRETLNDTTRQLPR